MGPLTSSYVLCGSREANEGKLFELSPPAAYVVVGQLPKLRFPPPLPLLNEVESLHLVVGIL
jgi:hypothetical protein